MISSRAYIFIYFIVERGCEYLLICTLQVARHPRPHRDVDINGDVDVDVDGNVDINVDVDVDGDGGKNHISKCLCSTGMVYMTEAVLVGGSKEEKTTDDRSC
jgi:hypothetical protein